MPFQDHRVIHADGPWRVLAPRHEVMWRDGTTAYLHPVMQGDVPSPMLRAVHHEGLRWIILDLRAHSGEIEADLKGSLERDAPGIVFYTLRQAHRTARDFTDRIALHHVHAWWQAPTAEAA